MSNNRSNTNDINNTNTNDINNLSKDNIEVQRKKKKVSISAEAGERLNALQESYGLTQAKTLEYIISKRYDQEFNDADTIPVKQRQDVMVHMCKITEYAKAIENDELRKIIMKESDKACQLLNR